MSSPSITYGALPLTQAARSFYTEYFRLRTLAAYLVNASIAMHATVKTAFDETADFDEALARLAQALQYEGADAAPYPEEVAYKHHRGLVAEMMVSRTVDNFLTYLSDVMAEVLRARPEVLRSGATERLDYVLQFDTMEALRHALAEREVERLAFLGMRKLADELRKSQKLDLFPVDGDLDEAVYWVEVRNLITHNRGIVSRLSAGRSERLAALTGLRVPIEYPEVRGVQGFLRERVQFIDGVVVAKYSLPTHTGNLWPAELKPEVAT